MAERHLHEADSEIIVYLRVEILPPGNEVKDCGRGNF